MEVIPQPLTKDAFAPYGDVIDLPTEPGRNYYEDALGNLRPHARPSVSVSLKPDSPERPFSAELLERHEFSSQTFVPLDVSRYLVVVAPHAKAGGPDVANVKAFIATGAQGVTYKANTWHHGLTTLDRPGRFAIFMFRDGGETDEEFVPVAPFTIRIL
ncbi:MAG: ureidoglycolate lyase [Enhydrobacter sp.]